MNTVRKYGTAPFNVAVLHGGPGAPGEMAPVAKEISRLYGTLEPLQTGMSIDEQVLELADVLAHHGDTPLVLIGYSWGAWLGFIAASSYPTLIKKLILVSSGPFEAKYVSLMNDAREKRLSEAENIQIKKIMNELNNAEAKNKTVLFTKLGALFSHADSYNPMDIENDIVEYQPHVFKAIMNEAEKIRQSGRLLDMGRTIACPVVAIHGDYDPHPYIGVEIPLSGVIKNFRFILLDKCGHTPWLEKEAREEFFNVLFRELKKL